MKAIQLSRIRLMPAMLLGMLGSLFSFNVFAQPTFVGVSSNPADGGSLTTSTVTVAPPAGTQPGDLVVVYAHYRGNSRDLSISGGGQTWNSETQYNNNNQRTRIFWCVISGTLGNPTVTRSGTGSGALTAVMYVFRPTSGVNWVKHVGPNNANANTTTISITGITTTVPNTVTMAFWGSEDDVTWGTLSGTGWNKPATTQYRNMGSAGNGDEQSHTGAYNTQASAAAIPNVSQKQSAATAAVTSIISWAEVLPPANDDCSNAVSLTSATTCSTTSGTLIGATNTTLPSCSGTSSDVWYTFTALTTNPTITVNGGVGTNGRFQILSGTCGGTLSSEFCSTSSSQAASGLTIGDTYFLRIYTTGTANTFTVCIKDPVPANDAFASPVTLTPAATCSNTAGTLYGATYTAGTPTVSGTCAGTPSADVWYSFVAPTDVVSVPLTAGSEVSGVEMIVKNGSNYYSIACGGPAGIPAVAVVPGTTYYIRVYKTGAAPASAINAAFTICVTAAPPPNDDCSGAINLNVLANCNKVFGTVSLATLSAGFGTTGTCSGSGSAAYDVWYKFTATTTNPTITLNDFGAAFTGTRSAELYSGTCGSLTALNQCTTGSTPLNATGLTIGSTYYIRVYSTSAPTTGDGKFSICVTSGAASNVRIGNSYVNISKNTVGGVVENGDILEIRMTIWVGYSPSTTLYSARYVDNVPSKTTMQTGEEIQIITNEGLRYRGYTATDGLNDDAATYKSVLGAGEYNIRLNLGTSGTLPGAPADNTATNLTGANNLVSTSSVVPRAGGGLLFATSFRVQVTGNVGDTISLNGGQFIYKTSSGGSDISQSGIPYKILISDPLSLCANSVGVNNASESGGTFGSGNTMNRPYDLASPISGYSFVAQSNAQAVGDGSYAIVNNTSPRAGTNQNANRKPLASDPSPVAPDASLANRMFSGYWYINGDHTGQTTATNNAPVAQGSNGGYMLVVNADYVASEVYRQTLTNLCPNTYYEFSAWFKNICATCGSDSLGRQFNAAMPAAIKDGYPGVLPNLTFSMDGLDRYSTGQIASVANDITGDQGGWVKKGFVFRNDTAHQVVLSIRNNAQGGGGNDWTMDDVSIATCFPSMSYSPSSNPLMCVGNVTYINDTVRSKFNDYTWYIWQVSTDTGHHWTDITAPKEATAILNNTSGLYEYIADTVVVGPYINLTDTIHSGDIYRVYTATALENITNPDCVANDGSAPITLTVMDCGIVLNTDLLSFNGKLVNEFSVLSWSTSKEEQPVRFELQRSDDNIHFVTITAANGRGNGESVNYYSFTDPQLLKGKKWYRLILKYQNGTIKYSQSIQLINSKAATFALENVVNPFRNQLLFTITTGKNTKADAELIDMQGRVVRSGSYLLFEGTNSLSMANTDALASGIYTLRIRGNDRILLKRVMKDTR